MYVSILFFFFFSSRRRHTRCLSDWSSDVCSSDLHVGHLIVAEQCREQGRLDEVWFVPSATPPHKAGQPITRFEQRVEMLALAVAGHPVFRINEIENETPGPNFTVLTLTELHRRHPDAAVHLLIGSDSRADVPKWRGPA